MESSTNDQRRVNVLVEQNSEEKMPLIMDDKETIIDHSPYLVKQLLANQKPYLYGVVKFNVVSEEIKKVMSTLSRPVRILDLGSSTSSSKLYLEGLIDNFEYCSVDYEAKFKPDIVMGKDNTICIFSHEII